MICKELISMLSEPINPKFLLIYFSKTEILIFSCDWF